MLCQGSKSHSLNDLKKINSLALLAQKMLHYAYLFLKEKAYAYKPIS